MSLLTPPPDKLWQGCGGAWHRCGSVARAKLQSLSETGQRVGRLVEVEAFAELILHVQPEADASTEEITFAFHFMSFTLKDQQLPYNGIETCN
jgi:hypothetical protein